MAEAGCTGPQCRFVGTGEKFESAALPGECTGTAGYLSEYEIRQIIRMAEYPGETWPDWDIADDEESTEDLYVSEPTFETWYDEDSQSDILVYGGTEWVAWMDDVTKRERVERYKAMNFAGVSDWAVDLSVGCDFTKENENDGEDEGVDPCDLNRSFNDLQDLEQNGADLSNTHSRSSAACSPKRWESTTI